MDKVYLRKQSEEVKAEGDRAEEEKQVTRVMVCSHQRQSQFLACCDYIQSQCKDANRREFANRRKFVPGDTNE